MPNDERILETMPTGTLGLIPTASCMELGKKVDSYLSTWREHREHEHHNDIAFKEYHQRELHHRASYSTIWFRRSEMCYQSVCPGL